MGKLNPKCSVLFAAIGVAGCLFADTFVWKYSAGDDRQMTTAANWKGGVAPTLTDSSNAPDINFDDPDVPYSVMATNNYPIIEVGTDASLKTPLYYNSVSGSPYTRFRFTSRVNSDFGNDRNVTVVDPSGYYGWWRVLDAPVSNGYEGPQRAGLFIDQADESKAVLHNVDVERRIRLITENTLTVENGRGAGTIEINTASHSGKVKLPNSFGPRTDVVVRNGTMSIAGAAVADPTAPVAGAWAQLDASDISTLSVSGSDIYEWADKSGNGVVASSDHSYNKSYGVKCYPQLVDADKPGMKAVNFGAFGISPAGGLYDLPAELLEEFGPATCMSLGDGNRLVREIFFVYKENYSTNGVCYPCVAGPDFSYPEWKYSSGWAQGWTNRIARTRSSVSPMFKVNSIYGEDKCNQIADIRIDGQRVQQNYAPELSDRFHVISISLSDGLTTGIQNLSLSRDSNGGCSFGGFQLGEVLFYTNTLTMAERRQNTDYLLKKWLGGDVAENYDYGYVKLASASASLEVTSGCVKIRELDLPAGTTTFVKKGAGALRVDKLYVNGVRSNLPIRVEGGTFSYGEGCTAVAKVKAAEPDFWFDATQIDAADLDTTTTPGTSYVKIWRDARGMNKNGVAYTFDRYRRSEAGSVQTPIYPTLQANAANGHPAVDLGGLCKATMPTDDTWATDTNSTALLLFRDGKCSADLGGQKHYTREAFLVVKFKDIKASYFSGTIKNNSMQFFKYDDDSCFLRPNLASDANVDSAQWWLNGKPIPDPKASGSLAANKWYVISIAAHEKMPCDALGVDRGAYSWGGIQVGEVISYDRTLSASERRDTNAYLMDKWLGESHPDDGFEKSISTYTLASGTDPVIVSDDDIAIGNLAAESGEIGGVITKLGDGKVSIGTDFTGVNFTSVDVRGGELSLNFNPMSCILGKAFFHLDATVESSLTKTGGNFVTTWADCRGNGRVAAPSSHAWLHPGMSPRLKSYTINGRAMNAVSCGPACNVTNNTGASARLLVTPESTGLNWYTTSTADRAQTYEELYIVCKSLGWYVDPSSSQSYYSNTSSRPRLFDCIKGYDGSNLCGFFINRDNNQSVLHPSVASGANLRNGRIWRDDSEWAAWNSYSAANAFWNSDDFHAFAFAPSGPVTNVNAFCCRGNNEFGGTAIGESIVFAAANSEDEKTAIRKYLQKKWFGDEWAGLPTALSGISVADGSKATINVNDYVSGITVASLSGRGTIDTEAAITGVTSLNVGGAAGEPGALTVSGDVSLAGVSSLTLDFASASAYDSIVSGGTLTLPATCALTVNLPATIRKANVGEYAIVSADTLSGDISGWTVSFPGLTGGEASVVKRGNSLYLVLASAGLQVIVQ